MILIGLGVAIILVSYLLGPRRIMKGKLDTYECGMPLFEDSRKSYDIKYYIVAALFILFDIEVLFLIIWAVGSDVFSFSGLIKIFIFLFILTIGLIWAILRGALEWD